MSLYIWIVIFSLVGGLLSVVAAASYLLLSEHHRIRSLPHMVSFAIGALLGAAFLGLLPHALMSDYVTDSHDITLTVLFGLLGFFILEKMVLWRHCHAHDCEVHGSDEATEDHDHAHAHSHHGHGHSHRHAQEDEESNSAGSLVLIGDAFHNFVDGVLIAAAFITDIELGVVTALAVAAHEIPQELGDFAILLQSGFTRKKALVYNILSSLTTVVGATIAYLGLNQAQHIVPFVLAIAAASFIYVAVADLIPGLHKRTEMKESFQQVSLILFGVATIYFAHSWLH